jgi:hypothetical protein
LIVLTIILNEKKKPGECIVPRYPRHLYPLNLDISRDTSIRANCGIILLGFLLEIEEAPGITTKLIDSSWANTRRLDTPVSG